MPCRAEQTRNGCRPSSRWARTVPAIVSQRARLDTLVPPNLLTTHGVVGVDMDLHIFYEGNSTAPGGHRGASRGRSSRTHRSTHTRASYEDYSRRSRRANRTRGGRSPRFAAIRRRYVLTVQCIGFFTCLPSRATRTRTHPSVDRGTCPSPSEAEESSPGLTVGCRWTDRLCTPRRRFDAMSGAACPKRAPSLRGTTARPQYCWSRRNRSPSQDAHALPPASARQNPQSRTP